MVTGTNKGNIMLVLQIAAVFSAYLILSLPLASAVTIHAYMPGSSDPVTFSFSPADKVERTFDVYPVENRGDDIWVKAGIVGRDSEYDVKKIFLFKCKDVDALSCSNLEPIVATNYLSGERKTFRWTGDLAVGRIANFLTFVQMEHNGRTIWVAFWDRLERQDINSFVHTASEIDSADVYLRDGVNAEWLKNYAEQYLMIPADWTYKTTVSTDSGKTDRIEANNSGMLVHTFQTLRGAGNTVFPGDNAYSFVFGSGSVESPLTFFSQPATTCGDTRCDTELGEDRSNCCIDCGCQTGQECTTGANYPNGLCHVCGDGTPDAVENSNNCCADAGCPEGLSCDASRNRPYGTCIPPKCGNGNCDTPVENTENCCIDCGGTDACKTALGTSFYCNEELVRCTEPLCGERGCEPGEDYTNCCTDCNDCPEGKYCNTSVSSNGLCLPPGCGENGCEPGEDYTNCCTDCNDCPADPLSGLPQVCTDNVCHACGNGYVESVENEQNCCQDTGCGSGYCSDDNSCRDSGDISLNVMANPREDIDCSQTGNAVVPVKVVLSLGNKPKHFGYFENARYTTSGKTRPLKNCVISGDAFECEIPLSGPDTFEGCFEGDGDHDVEISASISFYNDTFDRSDNNITRMTLTKSITLSVKNAKERTCNQNGREVANGCETALGEDSNICCFDCGCPQGQVCIKNGCSDEGIINLNVDESSIPDEGRLVCDMSKMVSDSVSFTADVENFPDSASNPFTLVRYELYYENMGTTYTPENLTGFLCEPRETQDGIFTGKIDCSIPISMFPACPFDSPAHMKLRAWVLGGGLNNAYSGTGKMAEDEFEIRYQKGLPHCNDGQRTCDEGENQDNCCIDCGCPEGEFCSLYDGCHTDGDLKFDVWTEPSEIDCSQSLQRKFRIFGKVTPEPAADVYFKDTELNRTYIDNMCSYGYGTTYGSDYTLECEMPYEQFPYCWGIYGQEKPFEFSIPFNTTFGYRNATDFIKTDLGGNARFSVTEPRARACNSDGICDAQSGETADQCCKDCGCTGGKMCTSGGECTSDEPTLSITSVPSSVDCSAYSDVPIKFIINNQPAWPLLVRFNASVDGAGYADITYYCQQDYERENEYICDVPVRALPVCMNPEGSGCIENAGNTYDCDRPVTMKVNVTYMKPATYERMYAAAETSTDIDAKDILASCGDGIPDQELGETQETCCQDMGCPDGQVCTVDRGCQSANSITVSLEPQQDEYACYIVPSERFNYPRHNEEGNSPLRVPTPQEVEDYGFLCKFAEPLKFSLRLSPEPYGIADIQGTFRTDDYETVFSPDTEERMFSVVPQPIEADTRESMPRTFRFNISVAMMVALPDGGSISINREMEFDKSLVKKDSKELEDIDQITKRFWDNLRRVQWGIAAVGFSMGFCSVCPGDMSTGPADRFTGERLIRPPGFFRFLSKIPELFNLLVTTLENPYVLFFAGSLLPYIKGVALRIISFFAGATLLGLLAGSYLKSVATVYCRTSFIQGAICAAFSTITMALIPAITVSIIMLNSALNSYEKHKKQAEEAKVGNDMSPYLYKPIGD